MLGTFKGQNNCSLWPVVPHAETGTYLPSCRATCLLFERAVSALLTDISPDLLPFRPIFSRSSPRLRPVGLSAMSLRRASRLLPRRALVGARRLAAARRGLGALPFGGFAGFAGSEGPIAAYLRLMVAEF